MGLPEFLLRKLYKKGSLHETAPGQFGFALFNRFGPATIVAPPHVSVNGITIPPERIRGVGVDLSAVSFQRPFEFAKGQEVALRLPGSLLRGGNHIRVIVQTKEFGELRIDVEDSSAEFCDLPGSNSAK